MLDAGTQSEIAMAKVLMIDLDYSEEAACAQVIAWRRMPANA